MTTTLYFYKLPVNLINKNFVLDSIETYLTSLTPVTKTNFQYQRFDLEKTIKVNLSQEYQLNVSSLTKYNYLKITSLDSLNNVATYYYFIKSARQVSQSTIEFDIIMDTLNTFKYVTSSPNPSNYTLSKKSLITREHKDRFGSIERIYGNVISGYDPRININYLFDLNYIASNFFDGITKTYNLSSATSFNLYIKRLSIIEKIENANDLSITFHLGVFPHVDSYEISTDISGPDTYSVTGLEIYISFNEIGYADNERILSLLKDINAKRFKEVRRRIVDEFQEGLGTTLFKKNEQQLRDADEDNQWYVVYGSSNAIGDPSVSEVKYVNPVQVRFYSDKGYSISTITSTEKVLDATSPLIPQWKNSYELIEISHYGTPPTAGEEYVKIAGVTYDFHDYGVILLKRTNNNDSVFSQIDIYDRNTPSNVTHLYNVQSIIVYGFNTLQVTGLWGNVGRIDIMSGKGEYSGSSPKWQEVNLADAKLIKAFAFPFAPCEFLVGQTSFTSLPDGFVFNADDFIEMNVPQAPAFNYQKVFEGMNPQQELFIDGDSFAAETPRNIKYESKLYHSDYYQPKFVYDSFSFSFNLENVDISSYISYGYFYDELLLNYVVSRNVQSKFMFSFPQYTLKKSIQDYDNVLCIERNNEKALYNNAYINYIRSGGYSYDTKKASSQNAVNGVTTALSIVGAVGSFALAPATGGASVKAGIALTSTAVLGIIRSVHTAQEQDRAIAQKINQQIMQGTSVQGSEDIDILTAFSGNKPKMVYYELSDIMKNAMWDLFHYCGYATHEQKIPNVNTRLYFNFVQGDIILKDFTFNEVIANDITAKWKQGITFMHLVNSTYDFEQEYENFESSLL